MGDITKDQILEAGSFDGVDLGNYILNEICNRIQSYNLKESH